MKNNQPQPFPWRLFIAEMAGTALLLLVGLSIVIFMFGSGSPMERLIPEIWIRRAMTGFLFGGTGALIALSAIGRESGAHINPVVTMTFLLFGKMDKRTAVIYIVAQLLGAVLGCLPLPLWGELGRSIAFGATTPGVGYTTQDALLGEAVTTFIMVSLLIVSLGFRSTRPYTPALFPFLYAIMVPLEAAVSGISTNPARSFGPSVISGVWQSGWIYWAGPIAGALLACLVCSFMAKRITVAKIYHFDSDRDGLFRRMRT